VVALQAAAAMWRRGRTDGASYEAGFRSVHGGLWWPTGLLTRRDLASSAPLSRTAPAAPLEQLLSWRGGAQIVNEKTTPWPPYELRFGRTTTHLRAGSVAIGADELGSHRLAGAGLYFLAMPAPIARSRPDRGRCRIWRTGHASAMWLKVPGGQWGTAAYDTTADGGRIAHLPAESGSAAWPMAVKSGRLLDDLFPGQSWATVPASHHTPLTERKSGLRHALLVKGSTCHCTAGAEARPVCARGLPSLAVGIRRR